MMIDRDVLVAFVWLLSIEEPFFVGMQGIEPCLTAPKAVVLPVYDIPL